MSEYKPRVDVLSTVRKFVEVNYLDIERDLQIRRSQFKHLTSILDPFSTDSCRCAVFSVEDSKLVHSGLMRAGGDIRLTLGETNLLVRGHAYFASIFDSNAIGDFTSGQFALALGVSFDSWIKTFPHLFIGRVLVGDKREISKSLGIYYPARNVPFMDYFWGS